jgi:hypothetical protein
MPTQEIQSTNWKEFCQRFQQLHNGALMTIQVIEPSGYRREIANRIPLQSMKFQQGSGCVDKIFVTVFQEGQREITHEIVDPIHVKVREEGVGSKALQIDAENGSTLLTFSSGKMEELLEGLEGA